MVLDQVTLWALKTFFIRHSLNVYNFRKFYQWTHFCSRMYHTFILEWRFLSCILLISCWTTVLLCIKVNTESSGRVEVFLNFVYYPNNTKSKDSKTVFFSLTSLYSLFQRAYFALELDPSVVKVEADTGWAVRRASKGLLNGQKKWKTFS